MVSEKAKVQNDAACEEVEEVIYPGYRRHHPSDGKVQVREGGRLGVVLEPGRVLGRVRASSRGMSDLHFLELLRCSHETHRTQCDP